MPGGVRLGILPLEPRRDDVQFRLGLLDGDALLEFSDDPQVVETPDEVAFDVEWNRTPEVGFREQLEPGRHHADDLV